MQIFWDAPIQLENVNKNNLADFLLEGKFKEHCHKNSQLNDSIMKQLNKDIYNRVYTLLINNIL